MLRPAQKGGEGEQADTGKVGALAFINAQLEDQRSDAATSADQGPTAWVGGLPGPLAANESDVIQLFSQFGELEPEGIKIRQKEGNYKSWCLVTFRPWDPGLRLGVPSKLRKLHHLRIYPYVQN